ncbi:unnamed protein product, partial [Owenia fusiformis]
KLVNMELSTLPRNAFNGIMNLQILRLDGNHFKYIPAEAFNGLDSLRTLRLDGNKFTEVPSGALNKLHNLEGLKLGSNFISSIPEGTFKNLKRLEILLLEENDISSIDDDAFQGLYAVEILEINANKLKHLPVALRDLPALVDLSLADNRIHSLPQYGFLGNQNLEKLLLKGNPIDSVDSKAFTRLPHLDTLVLSDVKDQTQFPDFNGTTSLTTLKMDRGNIERIPEDLCTKIPAIKSLDLHSNRIRIIPELSKCKQLYILNLGNNLIESLEGSLFKGLHKLQDLTISKNHIQMLPNDAFLGDLTSLEYIDLEDNEISHIEQEAFAPLGKLETLNLADNKFDILPTKGLEGIKILKTFGTNTLLDFPSSDHFPVAENLWLSYVYHCCDYINQNEEDKASPQLSEITTWLPASNWSHFPIIHDNTSVYNSSLYDYDKFLDEVMETFGTQEDYPAYPDDMPEDARLFFDNLKPQNNTHDIGNHKPQIKCFPHPTPFEPCNDLMGSWALRCGVWIVFFLALIGNATVLFVLTTARTKLDVPRFLICNLACADFFMGIYLGFLAIVDASTLGEFKKHGTRWQNSPGCIVAGFLGVLSSELSVFTLAVITLERFYAITHAMHLNKRLSLRHAAYVMTCGWGFALLLASMPIFGVSDYKRFAVCLPFDVDDPISKGYVGFILVFNSLAFFTIVMCYAKMYYAIRGSQAWNSNDSRIAKRMALLVFTDFGCWAPIALFSFTAAFDRYLITLEDAKFLTIFVLPLNSCVNPFLYAICTKQFKKDCVVFCKRLEETSISRGISRLTNRHNMSMSVGSSRRLSALNSFFASMDKRDSRSWSGGQCNVNDRHNNGRGSGGSRGSRGSLVLQNINNLQREADMENEAQHVQPSTPLCAQGPIVANGNAPPSKQTVLSDDFVQPVFCLGETRTPVPDKKGLSPDNLALSERRPSSFDKFLNPQQLLLSILKRKKEKEREVSEACKEDSVWVPREDTQESVGMFPLMPLGESPGGARRSCSPKSPSWTRRLKNATSPKLSTRSSCLKASSSDYELMLNPAENTQCSYQKMENILADNPSGGVTDNDHNSDYMNYNGEHAVCRNRSGRHNKYMNEPRKCAEYMNTPGIHDNCMNTCEPHKVELDTAKLPSCRKADCVNYGSYDASNMKHTGCYGNYENLGEQIQSKSIECVHHCKKDCDNTMCSKKSDSGDSGVGHLSQRNSDDNCSEEHDVMNNYIAQGISAIQENELLDDESFVAMETPCSLRSYCKDRRGRANRQSISLSSLNDPAGENFSNRSSGCSCSDILSSVPNLNIDCHDNQYDLGHHGNPGVPYANCNMLVHTDKSKIDLTPGLEFLHKARSNQKQNNYTYFLGNKDSFSDTVAMETTDKMSHDETQRECSEEESCNVRDNSETESSF